MIQGITSHNFFLNTTLSNKINFEQNQWERIKILEQCCFTLVQSMYLVYSLGSFIWLCLLLVLPFQSSGAPVKGKRLKKTTRAIFETIEIIANSRGERLEDLISETREAYVSIEISRISSVSSCSVSLLECNITSLSYSRKGKQHYCSNNFLKAL